MQEAGFDTGRGVMVKVSQSCIVQMADENIVQKLHDKFYFSKQMVNGIRTGCLVC